MRYDRVYCTLRELHNFSSPSRALHRLALPPHFLINLRNTQVYAILPPTSIFRRIEEIVYVPEIWFVSTTGLDNGTGRH